MSTPSISSSTISPGPSRSTAARLWSPRMAGFFTPATPPAQALLVSDGHATVDEDLTRASPPSARPTSNSSARCVRTGWSASKMAQTLRSSTMRPPAHFQKSILSIGRFAKNKRIDLLIEFVQALRRLRSRMEAHYRRPAGRFDGRGRQRARRKRRPAAMPSTSSLRPRMRRSRALMRS